MSEPNESGSLALKTAAGSVQLHKPVTYQQGPAGETEVACGYFLDKYGIRFALDDYDLSPRSRIDLVLPYAARPDATLDHNAGDGSETLTWQASRSPAISENATASMSLSIAVR